MKMQVWSQNPRKCHRKYESTSRYKKYTQKYKNNEMPAHLVAGSKTLRNVNASEIKPRKKLQKKNQKQNVCIKNITGKISINVFIDGTKSGLRCFYFAALSLSFLQSQSLPLSCWRENAVWPALFNHWSRRFIKPPPLWLPLWMPFAIERQCVPQHVQ